MVLGSMRSRIRMSSLLLLVTMVPVRLYQGPSNEERPALTPGGEKHTKLDLIPPICLRAVARGGRVVNARGAFLVHRQDSSKSAVRKLGVPRKILLLQGNRRYVEHGCMACPGCPGKGRSSMSTILYIYVYECFLREMLHHFNGSEI